MQAAKTRASAAAVDLQTATTRMKEVEAALEEAKLRVKLAEMTERHAWRCHEAESLKEKHGATLDKVSGVQ